MLPRHSHRRHPSTATTATRRSPRGERQPKSPPPQPNHGLKHRLIAHAMGSVDGKAYTNSYDAFMTNYKRGYRLFEVDLIMTPTLAQFESAKIDGKYRPLSWRDVAELMKRYLQQPTDPELKIIIFTASAETAAHLQCFLDSRDINNLT